MRYCTLKSLFFFASRLGVLPVLIKDRDDSAGVPVGRDDDVDVDSPADHGGILDGDPVPNSLTGSGRLELVSAAVARCGGTPVRA